MISKKRTVQFLDHKIENGAVFYHFSLTFPQTGITYFFNARYRQILSLHFILKNENASIPSFPPKKWWGNLKNNFIKKRKRLLENYINEILQNEGFNSDNTILSFFEKHLIQTNIEKGFKGKYKKNYSQGLAESFMGSSVRKNLSVGANISLLEQNQKEVFEGLKLYNEGKMNLLELLEISQLILSNERLENIQLIKGKKSTLDEKSFIFEINDENSKIWALRMIAIRLTDDNLLKFYLNDLLSRKFLIQNNIGNNSILFLNGCFLFEKLNRTKGILKRILLVWEEWSQFSLEDVLQERAKISNVWTEKELKQIIFDLIKNLILLRNNGLSHNFINPSNVLWSEKDSMFKLSNYKHIGSTHSCFDHIRFGLLQNKKFNSDVVNDLLLESKEINKEELLENDCHALGVLITKLINLNDSVKNVSTYYEISQIAENLITKKMSLQEIMETFYKDYRSEKLEIHLEPFVINKFNVQNTIEKNNDEINEKEMLAKGYFKIQLYKKSVSIYDQILPFTKIDNEFSLQRKKAKALFNLDLKEESIDLLKSVLKKEEIKDYQMSAIEIWKLLSSFLNEFCEYEKALKSLKKGWSILMEEKDKINDEKIVDFCNNLGLLAIKNEKYDDSLHYLEKALKIEENMKEKNPLQIGKTNLILGLRANQMSNPENALTYFEKAETELNIFFPAVGIVLAELKVLQAHAFISINEFIKASELLDQSWAYLKMMCGERCLPIADAFFGYGKLYNATKENNKSLSYLKQAYSIKKEILGKKHKEIADILILIGKNLISLNQFEKSKKKIKKAIKIFKKIFGKENFSLAELYNTLGCIYTKQDNLKSAVKIHKKCLFLYNLHFGENNLNSAIELNNLGSIFLETGDFEEAIKYFTDSFKIFSNFEKKQKNIGDIMQLMGIAYCNIGNYPEAKKCLIEAIKQYKETEGSESKIQKIEKDLKMIDENI